MFITEALKSVVIDYIELRCSLSLQMAEDLVWIALDCTGVPNKVDCVCTAPWQISSNGDRCEVKWSKAPSDLLEGGAVASVTSEEEPMVRAQNRPAAP